MSDLSFAGLFNAAVCSTRAPRRASSDASTHPVLTAALAYAAKGWAACPCKAGDKAPATQHGYKDASTDPQRVRSMFSAPSLNIGVATGDVSGVFVLDVDPRNGGDATLAALLAEHGPLPDTYKVKTGGGGWHYYFRKTPGMKLASTLGEGLDVKADGGYVIAPPSRTTGAYTVASDVPVVEAPGWMVERLTQVRTALPATQSPLPGALPDALRGLSGTGNADLTTGIGQDWSEAPENIAQVRDMLAVLPADERAFWCDICMAVKSLNWTCGEALARDWSKKSAKYSDAGFNRLWGSISPDGGTTIGTLIHHAKEAGWTAPRPALADASSSVQPGSALTEPASIEALAALPQAALAATLAKMERFDYDRVRAPLAEKLGVRVSTIDDEVDAARGDERDGGAGRPLTWDEVGPWPVPVDGAALLTEIAATIRRYVVCDTEGIDASALWVATTYLLDAVRFATRLFISAPEKGCGKTHCLTIVGWLSRRPLQTINLTPAALFRVIDLAAPTVLIDEVDRIPRDAVELIALMNAGHSRSSSQVIRTVGDNHDVRMFSAWAAMAFAGIGRLPDTTQSRCVVVPLRRKLRDEVTAKPSERDIPQLTPLLRKLVRWAADHAADVARLCEAGLPDAAGLSGRDSDNWESLLAVAHAAGGDWPARAARAARTLTHQAVEAGNEGRGVELLAAIRQVFDQRQTRGHAFADRIPSVDLCDALVADVEGPWATYNRGRPIGPDQIAKRLREFGVTSKTIRTGDTTSKGYTRESFVECWDRYLQPTAPAHEAANDGRSELGVAASPALSAPLTPTTGEMGAVRDIFGTLPDTASRRRRRS